SPRCGPCTAFFPSWSWGWSSSVSRCSTRRAGERPGETPVIRAEVSRSTEPRDRSAVSARTLREIRRHVLLYAGLLPFVAIATFPIVWMAITAFKEEADLYRMDQFPLWFHLPPTLKNFRILFSLTYFGSQLVNTILLAVSVVLITLVTALPAGYVLARLRLPAA